MVLAPNFVARCDIRFACVARAGVARVRELGTARSPSWGSTNRMANGSRSRKSHSAQLTATCLCTREPAGSQGRIERHKPTRSQLVRGGGPPDILERWSRKLLCIDWKSGYPVTV